MTTLHTAEFHVLIPAAGSGSRMGSVLPKQYSPLFGSSVIAHTLQVFLASSRIRSVTVVLSADDAHWSSLALAADSRVNVVRCGGSTRSETVLNGLQTLSDRLHAEDWVLVHDAARPGLNAALLNRLLDALQHDAVGGLLAIPLADTLKRADHHQRVVATEPRDHLWHAQTPQMFRYGMLRQALSAANIHVPGASKPTDEAQAIEALGYQPRLVVGELRNLKITYPQDLQLMEAILAFERNLMI